MSTKAPELRHPRRGRHQTGQAHHPKQRLAVPNHEVSDGIYVDLLAHGSARLTARPCYPRRAPLGSNGKGPCITAPSMPITSSGTQVGTSPGPQLNSELPSLT